MGEVGDQSPHVAVLPSPGAGHLIPLAELAKRLVLHHAFTATVITSFDFSSSYAQTAFLNALPAGLSYVALPSTSLDDLPPDARVETRLSVTVARSLPHLRDVLHRLKDTTRLAALVVDLFYVAALPVAKELGVPCYLFSTINFMALCSILHLPALHAATSCEYRDLPEPVVFPGCVPLRGVDLADSLQDRTNEAYKCALHIAERIREVEGILVNSFVDLEPETYKALKIGERAWPPVYPAGPLVWLHREESSGSECLKWLDDQPRGSVLYVAFGSGGTLSTEQTRELALGLEMSDHIFLWVARCPSDGDKCGGGVDPLDYLPEGFLERTKGAGLVVPQWAPQAKVLRHESTGGFLTHCGWNSALESMACGVPMVAWPLYAEQRMNAVMLAEEEVGAGAALRVGADGVVRAGEVSAVVKELMQGEGGRRARSKVQALQGAGAKAWAKDGSSFKGLAEAADKWKATVATSGPEA